MDIPSTSHSQCPICNKGFPTDQIEVHANRCIFLNTTNEQGLITSPKTTTQPEKKRNFQLFDRSPAEIKRPKLDKSKKIRTNGSSKNVSETVVLSDDTSNSETSVDMVRSIVRHKCIE